MSDDGTAPREAPLDPEGKKRVGRRIAEFRKRAGLSQRALAPQWGISLTQVGRIESGHSRPAKSLLPKLAEILGKTVDDILGPTPTTPVRHTPASNAVVEAPLDAEGKIRVGRKIAAIRQRKKLSQLALAKLLGVSRSQLCNVEAGRNRISTRLLPIAAKVLDTTVDDILGPAAVAVGNSETRNTDASQGNEAEHLWVKAYRAMTPAMRQTAWDYVLRVMTRSD